MPPRVQNMLTGPSAERADNRRGKYLFSCLFPREHTLTADVETHPDISRSLAIKTEEADIRKTGYDQRTNRFCFSLSNISLVSRCPPGSALSCLAHFCNYTPAGNEWASFSDEEKKLKPHELYCS